MRFRPLALLVALAVGLFLAPLGILAQPAKVHRIGFLSAGSSPGPASPHLNALRQGFADLGYVEGQNIAIEFRWAEGKVERLADLAADLFKLKVDVIVAVATPAARAAKQATATIPIVMLAVGDPVGTGLVASLARPGGNVTGLASQDIPELNTKRLELVKEALPGLARVVFLLNSALPHSPLIRDDIGVGARKLGVRVEVVEVRGPDDFDGAFATISRQLPDALLVHPDPLAFNQRKRIVGFAAMHKVPGMYGFREFVEAGGLMAYGPSLPDLFRRAPTYVARILKGARPADLPVEQPTKFELAINMKTAKALGLTIPPSILIRADEVIE